MPKKHDVRQGEHIGSIADRYGFSNAKSVWDDAGNAELRSKRDNPYVLAPGDAVTVPDRQQKRAFRPTGARHTFVVSTPPLLLRVRLLDYLGRPIAAIEASSDAVSGEPLVTDAGGEVAMLIRPSLTTASIATEIAPARLRVGVLDPIDRLTGVRGRLLNLGYLLGSVDDPDDVDEMAFALSDFQADQGLSPTGELDDTTRAKLRDAHGS